jgi:exodeoxyribonuclease VII small subunit
MTQSNTKDDNIKDIPFEEGMRMLEKLVAEVESGSLSLEQVVSSYEKGVSLVTHLRTTLQGAEEKIKVLQKDMTTLPLVAS